MKDILLAKSYPLPAKVKISLKRKIYSLHFKLLPGQLTSADKSVHAILQVFMLISPSPDPKIPASQFTVCSAVPIAECEGQDHIPEAVWEL